ncbi:MAG: cyclic nucleotide-binding domain-containing protein [Actinomycetota bacterium]
MRRHATVTSLSWIPSEAVEGMTKLGFESGFTHYDAPPPDTVAGAEDVEALRAHDRFRFANRLDAWIEAEDGRITAYGYGAASGGVMGATTVQAGPARVTFQAFAMPEIRHEPEVGDGWVRFVQTTGGRTGLPAPRRVRRKPYVQFRAPLVWTTLALTLHADGREEWEVVGASPFPRHWIYGPDGKLAGKVGLADFRRWWRSAFGRHSPWGDEESPALVTAAETALERRLSTRIMQGAEAPMFRRLERGGVLVREGEEGDDLYLLLDGVLRVEAQGRRLAEIGPGALLGERAGLEGGRRTATLTAVTPCRVAVVQAGLLDRAELEAVSRGHRREEPS